jgi:hypothetical protein
MLPSHPLPRVCHPRFTFRPPFPSPLAVPLTPSPLLRPLAPGRYSLTATLPGYQPSSAVVVIPEDGSGATQDFKLTPATPGSAPTAASQQQQQQQDEGGLEEGLSVWNHPLLEHVGLRSNQLVVVALVGLLLCGGGGWALLRVHGRWPGKLLRLPRREYELVDASNTLANANGAHRV